MSLKTVAKSKRNFGSAKRIIALMIPLPSPYTLRRRDAAYDAAYIASKSAEPPSTVQVAKATGGAGKVPT
jgi:hypothetical protein